MLVIYLLKLQILLILISHSDFLIKLLLKSDLIMIWEFVSLKQGVDLVLDSYLLASGFFWLHLFAFLRDLTRELFVEVVLINSLFRQQNFVKHRFILKNLFIGKNIGIVVGKLKQLYHINIINFFDLVSLTIMSNRKEPLIIHQLLALLLLLMLSELVLPLHRYAFIAHCLFEKDVLHIAIWNIAVDSQAFQTLEALTVCFVQICKVLNRIGVTKEVLCRPKRRIIIFHHVYMRPWDDCGWLLVISLLLLSIWWQFDSFHGHLLAVKSSTAGASFWCLGFGLVGKGQHLLGNLRTQTGFEHLLDIFLFFCLGKLSDSVMVFLHCFFLGLRQISVKLSHVKLLRYRPAAEIRCAVLPIRLEIQQLWQLCLEIRNY